MNEFCNNNAYGYKVLKIEYIDKGYQNQLWAFIKCPNENHNPYWVCWNRFKKGNRCKQCYIDKNNITIWDKHTVYDYCLSNGYKMLDIDDYINVDKSFYCYDQFGFIVKVSISNLKRLLSGKYNVEKFSIIKNNKYAKQNIDLFCKIYRPEYEFISKQYLGVKQLHWFKYNGEFLREDKYKREFQCTVDCFINGHVSHPYINKSSGEICVENWLINNNIKYIPQYTFLDCKDKQALPFDFYLPDHNIVIEYNGKQHYESIEFFGGQKSFEYIQYHDKIKTEYCLNNKIPLIRIPYWENKNMESFLLQKMKELNLYL